MGNGKFKKSWIWNSKRLEILKALVKFAKIKKMNFEISKIKIYKKWKFNKFKIQRKDILKAAFRNEFWIFINQNCKNLKKWNLKFKERKFQKQLSEMNFEFSIIKFLKSKCEIRNSKNRNSKNEIWNSKK